MQIMQRRKTLSLIIFLFISVLPLFSRAKNQDEILVSKIKVFLDDEELDADSEPRGKIKLSTILSYSKFREGKSFSGKAFAKEIERTKLRLMDSGLFYSAEVEASDSKKNPGSKVIYVSVQTGFHLRFGGGKAYGFFGKAALGGNRNILKGYLGSNKNGVSYLDENTFGLPLIFGASLLTNAPLAIAGKEDLSFDAILKTGFFLNPELKLGLDLRDEIVCTDKTVSDYEVTVSPYISQRVFLSEKLTVNTELRSFSSFCKEEGSHSAEAAINADYTPFSKITLAGLLSGGCNISDAKIDLEKTAIDLYDGLGLANRGIRSGYKSEDLATDCYGLASAEIRWNALSFNLPPSFPVQFVPFVFTDLALAYDYTDHTSRFLDAYGIGLQINFECPVFAYFNFSYGVNHLGERKFIFSAMKSF